MSLQRRLMVLVGVAMLAVLALAALGVWMNASRIVEGRPWSVGGRRRIGALHRDGVPGQGQGGADGSGPGPRLPLWRRCVAHATAVATTSTSTPDRAVNVMLPPKPEWEGQNKLGQVPDGRGGDVIQSLVNAVGSTTACGFADTMFPRRDRLKRWTSCSM
jgi:hypothetical protein